jgi:hypothetical protein
MISQRKRPILLATIAIAAIWLVAFIGYSIAKNARVTPEKVRAYVESIDLSRLSAADRAAALRKLEAMLNSLTLEERQSLRINRTAYRWFEQMTEDEKGEFLDATMPTGFKQMLAAFEEMPEDKRKRTIDEAVKGLREARQKMAAGGKLPAQTGTNAVALSDELRQKVTTIGLKTFYGQSSAQTKAEMAPLLEEMQQAMESGRMMRGDRNRN